eukprot:897486-Prymnesium_polylepis.1
MSGASTPYVVIVVRFGLFCGAHVVLSLEQTLWRVRVFANRFLRYAGVKTPHMKRIEGIGFCGPICGEPAWGAGGYVGRAGRNPRQCRGVNRRCEERARRK